MADCYVVPTNPLPPTEALPRAKAAATKALEIDNTLAEAHTSLAVVMMQYDWDWAGTEREFQRAIELNPNYATAHQWYAEYLAAMGRLDEAIAKVKRAEELDPLSFIISWNVGRILIFARQYDQALEQGRKMLELYPTSDWANEILALAYEQSGLGRGCGAGNGFVRATDSRSTSVVTDSRFHSIQSDGGPRHGCCYAKNSNPLFTPSRCTCYAG